VVVLRQRNASQDDREEVVEVVGNPPCKEASDSNRFALITSSGVSVISSGLRKTITIPLGFASGP